MLIFKHILNTSVQTIYVHVCKLPYPNKQDFPEYTIQHLLKDVRNDNVGYKPTKKKKKETP